MEWTVYSGQWPVTPDIRRVAPAIRSLAQLRRRIVLPLEGKGDRSAVDEVKMHTRSPSRSVKKRARYRKHISNYRAPLLPIAYCLLNKNPSEVRKEFQRRRPDLNR